VGPDAASEDLAAFVPQPLSEPCRRAVGVLSVVDAVDRGLYGVGVDALLKQLAPDEGGGSRAVRDAALGPLVGEGGIVDKARPLERLQRAIDRVRGIAARKTLPHLRLGARSVREKALGSGAGVSIGFAVFHNMANVIRCGRLDSLVARADGGRRERRKTRGA
jgi:hypothetical protein